jgi:hypothetical protein
MNGFNLVVPLKVFGIECKDALDAVDIHCGNKAGVMHLNA